MVAPLAGAIPTAQRFVAAIKQNPVHGFVLPSVMPELSDSPELLNYCSQTLELLLYAGGGLPKDIGEIVYLSILQMQSNRKLK